jgi:hypothetical protein
MFCLYFYFHNFVAFVHLVPYCCSQMCRILRNCPPVSIHFFLPCNFTGLFIATRNINTFSLRSLLCNIRLRVTQNYLNLLFCFVFFIEETSQLISAHSLHKNQRLAIISVCTNNCCYYLGRDKKWQHWTTIGGAYANSSVSIAVYIHPYKIQRAEILSLFRLHIASNIL